jgi:hypothetical protein
MEKIMTLDELATKYNTDKGPNGHMYTSRYSVYLEAFRDIEFNLLEIGVYDGASVKMWKEYFPKANIVAIDIDPRCKEFEEDRINIHIGDQTDVNFLNQVVDTYGHFEVILDDGGHSWKQQIVSFETLFPRLTAGGLYFLEDMHTSYRKGSQWDDLHITGVEYFKRLVDEVNINGKSFCGYSEIGNQPLSYTENNLDYIHFYKSLIVMSKKETSIV